MLYALTVPAFAQSLSAMSSMLDKAETWASANGVSVDELLASRIAPDMFPLETQVRFVCTQALQAMTRLGCTDVPPTLDTPGSLADLRAHLAATTAYLATQDEAGFTTDGDRPIEMSLPNGMTFHLTTFEYVRDWSLPQFYFHWVAAYMILRQRGVALGKADYVPYMLRYLQTGAAPQE